MKNLFLYKHFQTDISDINIAESFCISPYVEEAFVYDNYKIYKLSTRDGNVDIVYDIIEYYGDNVPKIVHMNSITDSCLCLAFENGDVVTLDINSKELECVGCVESGLKTVEWSPDQEAIVMVTGLNTLIVMTGTFDPIIEVDCNQSGFGEKQFITVGWGKKETQFHGSEGKAAARQVKCFDEVKVLDDFKPNISWRGDGSLFAVSTVMPNTNIRQIRIFSRDGILQYTSESVVGLEGALCWRPSGNLIATSQRLPNKHVIAFFEKNGLRHGEFLLPFAQNDCKINKLSWNSESSILLVWAESTNGCTCLQLWTTNNYHWYLKQNINFPSGRRLLNVEWDVLVGNRLHVLFEGLSYVCYEWGWTVNHSQGNSEEDEAVVAVIDGAKLLMTSFRRGIVPPPMCSQTLQLPLAASHIMFGPLMVERMVGGKEADINSNALAVVLYDGTIMTFRHAVNEKKHIEPIVCNLDYKNPTDLHHWIWLKEDLFLCCFTKGKTSYILQLLFDLDERKITTGQNFATGGIVVSMVRRTNDSALVQLEDGSLYIYKPDQNEMVPVHKCNPEACETLQVCEVDDKNVILGLSSRNRLYVDGEEVANNVTSVLVHSEFILLTTLKHMLLCAQLNQKGLQSLIEGKCGPGRHIERGARLVISVPGDTRVVLQMPRGNLECIQPRPLTLHVASVLLDRKKYGSAFQLLRKQRINLNLLCDHKPKVFLDNVDLVVDELVDPAWLSLFLSELQDENFAHNMYKEYYTNVDQLPDALNDKIQVVCDALRASMLSRENADHYLLPILTSHVQKQTDKDLADALLRVKAVREAEKKNCRVKVSADEALRYLLYLVDVNRLYDVALGLYDFDLVMLVAAKSNKDPKEYLPFLNELRRVDSNYCRFLIDKHLKKYQSALSHIALCPEDEKFEECLQLVKTHKLYSQALALFEKGNSRYIEIATIYGDYLMDSRQYQEAGVMYTRAGKLNKALTAYLQAGDWRATLLTAKELQYKENKLHELCQDVVTRLKIKSQFKEAAEVLSVHIGDIEESIAVLAQGKLWEEAVWSSSLHNRKDMIETHVKPGVMEHLKQLSSQLTSNEEQFIAYRNRLSVVRNEKAQRLHEDKNCDLPEECDLYSDTSSIMASSVSASLTGSRVTGRSNRSSKNRRKQERKMLSLKEGSPFEEYALIRALHQLISAINTSTEEVHNLCRILLKFEMDVEAANLQKLLSNLLHSTDLAKQEIWTPNLMQESQVSFGPDATVNSITSRLQTSGPAMPGLTLLEPQLRFPPPTKSSTNWQIGILKYV